MEVEEVWIGLQPETSQVLEEVLVADVVTQVEAAAAVVAQSKDFRSRMTNWLLLSLSLLRIRAKHRRRRKLLRLYVVVVAVEALEEIAVAVHFTNRGILA